MRTIEKLDRMKMHMLNVSLEQPALYTVDRIGKETRPRTRFSSLPMITESIHTHSQARQLVHEDHYYEYNIPTRFL